MAKTLTSEVPPPVALLFRALIVSTIFSVVLLFKKREIQISRKTGLEEISSYRFAPYFSDSCFPIIV